MFLFLLFLVSWLVSLLVASGALGELGGHISCLVAVGCHLLQVVGEEEHLQYGEYDEQLYAYKSDTSAGMDQFLKRHSLSKLTQEEIDDLNRPVYVK